MLTLIATIILFGVLVVIHEFGHFIFAKIFGVRVERFSIGFPPRIYSRQIGETDYQLGIIPLGGYVKLTGEGEEEGEVQRRIEPYEFGAKPAWQRFIIFIAGPCMNFFLAIFLIFGLLLVQGESYILSDTVLKVKEGTPAYDAGLKQRDKILEVNSKPLKNWGDIERLEELGKVMTLKVKRDDSVFTVILQPQYFSDLDTYWLGLEPTLPPYVGKVKRDGPAAQAGLVTNDLITGLILNPGTKDEKYIQVTDWDNLVSNVHLNLDKPLILKWKRGDKVFEARIKPIIDESMQDGKVIKVGLMGIGPNIPTRWMPLDKAIILSIKRSISFSGLLFKVLKGFITKPNLQEMGGPVRVVQAVHESVKWGLVNFLGLLAAISVQLAIFNLLPIPALDGGQILFLLVEGVIRRKLTIKQKQISQIIGFSCFAVLLVAVTYNDILRLFK